MDLILVPAWNRPEFLAACLKRLQIALKGPAEVWVCLDRRFAPDVKDVALGFQRSNQSFGLSVRIREVNHRYKGNSFNVLTAYKEALERARQVGGVDLIHLIEDDIFIAADYFSYHHETHRLFPEAFSVSACRNQNLSGPGPSPDPTTAYAHPGYQSLGVSFRPAMLQRVVPHVAMPYFQDPVNYVARCFPLFPKGRLFSEQDGLIHRIQHALQLESVFPAVPRAYHAGFHGYNRAGKPLTNGSIVERAAELLSMSAHDLNARAKSHPDHSTTELDAVRPPVSMRIDWEEERKALGIRPSASIVIPWARSDDTRARVRDWLLKKYETELPGYQVVFGAPSTDVWCKGEAVNRAVRQATGDVLIIADADCYVDPVALTTAVALVGTRTAKWVVPHKTVYRLNPRATEVALNGGPLSTSELDRAPYRSFPGGGIFVVGRDAFTDIGYPEQFKGWGGEDESMALVLDTLLGSHQRLDFNLFHLWHEPSGNIRDPEYIPNREMWKRFKQAAGNREAMWSVLRGESPMEFLQHKQVRLVALVDLPRPDGSKVLKGGTFMVTPEEARREIRRTVPVARVADQ